MPMPHASPPPSGRAEIDVQKLSVVQLQQMADRGSRRARAELNARMGLIAPDRAANDASAPRHAAAPPTLTERVLAPAAAPSVRAAPPIPAPPVAAPVAVVPDMSEVRAAMPPLAPSMSLSMSAPSTSGAPDPRVVEQLEAMARQDQQRNIADGPPRLVGMVLIVWGALLLLGALIMLGYRVGGGYYLFCGVSMVAVGWLLMQCSRWALALHGGLLLLGLGWAWAYAGGNLITALAQSAPLLLPGVWMLARPVREPLN